MKKVKKISKIFNSIVVSSLKNIPEYYHLEANQAECQKLAERFELVKILSLKADITMFHDDFVHVKGKISAQIRRQSVISLKEFTEKMDENFENLFCEPPLPETDEIIDEIKNGRIDLGEVIAEQFGLALNPFPHAPDEKKPYIYYEKDDSSENPFKNLSDMIKK